MENLRVYGSRPFTVAVVHGGPGAPGEMAPVARELSSLTGVLEPLQTKTTLEGQVEELKEVLEENADLPVTLIGYSWGAFLSFIVTARYTALVKKLVLVSSGPFEAEYAENLFSTRLDRLKEEERVELLSMIDRFDDPENEDKDRLLGRFGELMSRADSYDPLPRDNMGALGAQFEINQRVWQDAEKLRSSGELLEMGYKIECPVLALHGDYDPHPADGVKIPLSFVLKDFRFILLEKCGHCPWQERSARDGFYDILKSEI
jgi:pimeloyl-ACP methyl ester carboxylesterase